MTSTTIHASAVLTGARAVLIRGPSGAGKSRLALDLIEAGRDGPLRFARLVGDDRVHVQAAGGRLLVRPAEALAGLIEVRGLGILRLPHEPSAVVGHVVDLGANAERLPEADEGRVDVEGVSLPRLAVADGKGALPVMLALLTCGASAFCPPDFAIL
jgi:serine kinase of HPr protein (carbohydrate metabolism regulator)